MWPMNKCDQLDFLTLNDRAVEADKASFCSFIVFLCDYALGELWPWTWDVWGRVIWYLSNGCWRHEWPIHAWWYLNWVKWPQMEFKSELNLNKILIKSNIACFNNIDFGSDKRLLPSKNLVFVIIWCLILIKQCHYLMIKQHIRS